MKWLFMGLIVVVLALLAYLFMGVQDVSLERFELTGLSGISTNSVTLDGNFYFSNPSRAAVPVDKVPYTITLENGDTLGEGEISSFTLDPGESTAPFEHELQWIPTPALILDILTEDEVFVTVSGEIHVATLTIPFSQQIDIKTYIEQFVAIPDVELGDEELGLLEDLGLLS